MLDHIVIFFKGTITRPQAWQRSRLALDRFRVVGLSSKLVSGQNSPLRIDWSHLESSLGTSSWSFKGFKRKIHDFLIDSDNSEI